ncbi:coiled-coil domain-containing protein 103 isoform X1 [Hemiscyllium ocellatum]|uniref:coiled-coil domain-containing protein 103 isoform X1 n=1 Tax=Hemiscyllium ocellatum TaxID=170820 RepID=UPI0029665BD4|nr:coiled-coil domain-containing protein 103 isoform X1 [Hemiscyllium ocellatum]XP_060704736.1 coiled-coil domain-containing protein 103 isoform X1 [Hemiscyllium ocellatum]
MEESKTLDFKALKRELETALFLDEKYKRENDAKFRAIHQKVGSYEEFRDIVLASHLKPLDLRDKLGARNQPWNRCARSLSTKDSIQVGLSQHSHSKPKTAVEFSRDWRRYYSTEAEKYSFLLSLGGQLLGNIFRAEIGFGYLGEFLVILCNNFQQTDGQAIYWILLHLSQTQRFDLHVDFLSSSEREKGMKLFRMLLQVLDGSPGLGSEEELEGAEDVAKKVCAAEEAVNTAMVQKLMEAYKLSKSS